MSEFQTLLNHLPIALQIEISENTFRKDYSELEKAQIQRRLEAEFKKLIRPGRPKRSGKSVKSFTDNRRRVLAAVGSVFEESHTTVHNRLHIAKSVEKGDPRAKQLFREVDQKKRTLGSAYATLKIYERREEVELRVRGSSTNILPETIKFGDAFQLMRQLP
ncbi:MAG: hypothetical protein ACREBQ_12610, partial [Nitrososphaerales archaeon]